MKKFNFLLLTLSFSILGIISVFANKNVVIKGNGDTQISLVSNGKSAIVIDFSINGYQLNGISNGKGNPFIVNLPHGSAILEKGSPDLDKLTSSIIVSNTNRMKVEVIRSEYIEIKNIEVAPSRGNLYRNMNIKSIPLTKGDVYKRDEFFPGKLAELRDPYVLRDFRGQTIVTYPLQYNPVQKVLRIYTKLQVRVSPTGQPGANQLKTMIKFPVNREYNEIYSTHFINYSRVKYEPVSETGNMLIVTDSDYVNEITPFVEWKTKKGLNVEVVEFGAETTGTSAGDFKEYLADYYTNKGLTYLLLVGDAEDIPSLNQSGDSDVAYSYVSGADSYPDFFVGRFSAENSNHVKTQVDKVLYYERDIDHNATWLTKGMGIASDEGGGGQGDDGESDIQHMNNIKADLTSFGYSYVAEVYDPGATSSDVATDVENGVGVINYVGHGSDYIWVTSGFGANDCNSLTNVNKYPFIFDVACVNGNFHGQTCFAEAWARASHNNEATGSVAIIASTINQSWAPPMDGQDEMVDLLVESYENNIKRSFGGIAYSGCMHMNDEYGAEGDEMTDTWTTFGDPSLIVRTKTPEQMVISHANEILIGVTEFAIDVNAPDALACLSLNGKIVGTGVAEGGTAVISFDALTEVVDLDLVVTAYNKITYQTVVQVIPANGPYLAIKSFTIVDNSGNGTVEYGETFNVDLTLQNVGTETAEAVTATLTTDDSYITSITQNVDIAFPNIAADGTGTVTGKFIVTVKDSVPDQHVINFTITINDTYTGSKQEYIATKTVTVNAPVLTLKNLTYNDNFAGNLINGILDAGETGEVIFEIENKGHAALAGAEAQLNLVAASEYLTLNTTMAEIGNLMVSPTVFAKFNVTAAANTPLEEHIPVHLTISGGPYQTVAQEDIVIGLIPIFVMGGTDEVVACTGTFFDSGDETGNYGNNEDHTITFKPSIAGNLLEFTFESFETESGYDYLYIYNGETASGEEIAGSPFHGTNVPSKIMASNSSGALTFKFTSDGYGDRAGWKATFECIDGTAAPLCAEGPSPTNGANGVYSTMDLSWVPVSGAVEYDIYFGETLPAQPTTTVNTNTYKVENLAPYTEYTWKVIPKNMNGDAPDTDCGSWTFTTGAQIVYMSTTSLTTCEAVFMDDGGTGEYANDQNTTITFMPGEANKAISVAFTEFSLEANYDYIEIFNGPTTTSPLIGKYDGTDHTAIGDNGTVTANNDQGSLTVHFYSDGLYTYSGWVANITCVDASTDSHTLTFNVTDAHGAIAGAVVTIGDAAVNTDATGVAEFTLAAGNYSYTVTADNHIEASGSVDISGADVTENVVMTIIGVAQQAKANLAVYPNPSNGKFTITGVKANTVNVFNTSGVAVVKENKVNNNVVELSNLEQGIYFIQVTTQQNAVVLKKISILK